MKMKKVLLCLLTALSVMLLLGAVSVSATSPASAGELVISAESVTAPAGDTVSVTLSVTSNPGFSYLRLTVTQDDTLTLIEAENGTILKDFDQGVNLMWSADSQSTAIGVLVTLTFQVADNAVQGEYPIIIKFRECYNDNYDDVPTTIINGSVTVACSHKNAIVTDEIAATCTTMGLTEGKYCADCGEVLIAQEVIPAMGHTEVIDAAVSATCTEAGLTEGKHCSICEEVLVSQAAVPALGHDYLDRICTRCEGKYYSPDLKYTSLGNGECSVSLGKCTDADIVIPEFSPQGEKVTRIQNGAFQHCITLKSIEIPNSVTGIYGYAFHDCRELTSIKIPENVTYIGASAFYGCSSLVNVSLPAALNSIDDYAFQYCTSLVRANYSGTKADWIKLSMGKDIGELLKTNIYCLDGIICAKHTEIIDIAIAPTCTESGLSEGKHCSLCKEVLTTQEVIPALGHDYLETRVVTPTCTEIGYTVYTCENCGKSKNENTVPATGHTFLSYVYNNNATCTQNGTESAQCEHCDAKDSRIKEGTMLDHEFEWRHNSQSHYQVCINCSFETEHGLHRSDSPATEENAEICLDCGRVLTPPLQHVHSMTLIEEKLPTCTKKGNVEHYFCHKCGKLFEDLYGFSGVELQDVEIPATGHKYKSVVTEPTCLNQGYTTNTCELCSRIEELDYVQALGHDYKEMIVAPTCMEDGYTLHECARCDDSYTDHKVDALGHKPGTDADCLNDQTCTVCDEALVGKLGHDYNAVVTAPTCTEKGYTTHTCSRCDDTYTDSEMEELGHKPGAEADCLNDQTCTVCDEALVGKLGHDYNAVVTAPTCTEKGYTTHTCSRCDDTYTDSEVAELGHKPGTEADCLNDQICTVCGAVLVEKLGHDYNAVVTVPTCTEKGYTTHTCSRCGDTYTDSEVDALGHKSGEWIVDQEPAPGVEGSNHIECTVCGETLETAVIEALPVETETETEPEATPETDTGIETEAPSESEAPTEFESKQETPAVSNGCFGVVNVDVFCLIILMSFVSMLFVKRRKENC